jgi:hypothetical protein
LIWLVTEALVRHASFLRREQGIRDKQTLRTKNFLFRILPPFNKSNLINLVFCSKQGAHHTPTFPVGEEHQQEAKNYLDMIHGTKLIVVLSFLIKKCMIYIWHPPLLEKSCFAFIQFLYILIALVKISFLEGQLSLTDNLVKCRGVSL